MTLQFWLGVLATIATEIALMAGFFGYCQWFVWWTDRQYQRSKQREVQP